VQEGTFLFPFLNVFGVAKVCGGTLQALRAGGHVPAGRGHAPASGYPLHLAGHRHAKQ
jgi:hypothetical protein